MHAVQVQYTVKQAYVETNKANIQRVMANLKAINNPDLKYSSFLLEDGKTFVHFVMRADAAAQKVLSDLPSFQEFQRQLGASSPEVPPAVKDLTVVGTSWEVFN